MAGFSKDPIFFCHYEILLPPRYLVSEIIEFEVLKGMDKFTKKQNERKNEIAGWSDINCK